MIAAWADISSHFNKATLLDPTTGLDVVSAGMLGGINAGYLWMALNCLASAAYVGRFSQPDPTQPFSATPAYHLSDSPTHMTHRSCSCENESR